MNDQHVPRGDYPRFHLAFAVTDRAARRFYGDLLGCPEGRSSSLWVDFDFYGHQIVAHKVVAGAMSDATSVVDGDEVPVRHFGVILPMRVGKHRRRAAIAAATFVIAPHVRFKGLPGEQATMFFLDPFGNALEFKAFEHVEQLFAKQ